MDFSSRKYFVNMFRATDEPVICADSKLEIIYANRKASSILGLDEDSLSTLSCFLSTPYINKIKNSIKDKTSITFEFLHVIDNCAKRCVVVPTTVYAEEYVLLFISNTEPICLSRLERYEIDFGLHRHNEAIKFSTSSIISHLKEIGEEYSTDPRAKKIISNVYKIRRSMQHLEILAANDLEKPTDYHIDLNSYLSYMVKAISDIETNNKVTFELDLCKGLLNTCISYHNLDILICNIIENSIKNTLGYTKIKIKTSTNGNEHTILFSDNGHNSPALDKLFDDEHIKETSYGIPKAGTGLFVIRKIANLHGGSIFAKIGQTGGFELGVTLPKAKLRTVLYDQSKYPKNDNLYADLYTGLCAVIREYKTVF